MLSGLLLQGCGGPVDERVIVRVWAFPMLPELRDAEVYAELRKDFERENPGITVSVEMLPWAGRMQKMITAIKGNRAPDAVYLNLDFIPRLQKDGLLVPVDELMTAAERADYDPIVFDAVSMDNRAWMFPMIRTVTAAIYNKDLFAKAGLDPAKPPTTWKEVELIAQKCTLPAPGPAATQWGLGFVFGGDTLNLTFWPLLWQAGGDVLTADDRRAAFAGAEGIAALTFITSQYRKGFVPQSFMHMGGNEFASGRLAYYLGASQMEAIQVRRDAPNVNFGVGPVLKNKRRSSYATIGGFGIFKQTKHLEETAQWLRFLSRPENMKRFCKKTNYLPTKRSLGKIHQEDPILGAFENEAEFCRADVKSAASRQIMMITAPEIQAAALGTKTPEQALQDAEKSVNEMLARDQ